MCECECGAILSCIIYTRLVYGKQESERCIHNTIMGTYRYQKRGHSKYYNNFK